MTNVKGVDGGTVDVVNVMRVVLMLLWMTSSRRNVKVAFHLIHPNRTPYAASILIWQRTILAFTHTLRCRVGELLTASVSPIGFLELLARVAAFLLSVSLTRRAIATTTVSRRKIGLPLAVTHGRLLLVHAPC